MCAVELASFAAALTAGSFLCDNYDLLRTTALKSHGVWISSPQVAEQEIKDGKLIQLHVSDSLTPPEIDVYMIHMKGYQLSPSARRIADFVRGFFKTRGKELVEREA